MSLALLAVLMYLVQLTHSFEELTNGFHNEWYLFKMPFSVFLSFEVVFNIFWAFVIFSTNLPYRESLLIIWVTLMTLNGLQHIIWALSAKKYVPGLITAPCHLVLITLFCVTKLSLQF